MGKTLSATAVARLMQMDEGGRCIICCPPKLKAMWESDLDRLAALAEGEEQEGPG